jgi:hypothetical protein
MRMGSWVYARGRLEGADLGDVTPASEAPVKVRPLGALSFSSVARTAAAFSGVLSSFLSAAGASSTVSV